MVATDNHDIVEEATGAVQDFKDVVNHVSLTFRMVCAITGCMHFCIR